MLVRCKNIIIQIMVNTPCDLTTHERDHQIPQYPEALGLDCETPREPFLIWVDAVEGSEVVVMMGLVDRSSRRTEAGRERVVVDPVVRVGRSAFGETQPEVGMSYIAQGCLNDLQIRRETKEDIGGLEGSEIEVLNILEQKGRVIVDCHLLSQLDEAIISVPLAAFRDGRPEVGGIFTVNVIEENGFARLMARPYTEAELAAVGGPRLQVVKDVKEVQEG